MKNVVAITLLLTLCLSLTACVGGQPPQREPVSTVHSTGVMPESVTVTLNGSWPAADIPQPSGTISWVMTDKSHHTCGIQINGISKHDFKQYAKALHKAGFYEVEQAAEPVSIGTLYSNGTVGLSLAFTEPVLMVGILPQASSEGDLQKPVNIYLNAYARYDEEAGVEGVAELYVPEKAAQPRFTGLSGNLQVTLEDQHVMQYLGAAEDGTEAIAAALSTGVTGSSGDKGAITISGLAYADNAVFGGGAFTVSFTIKLP